MSWMSLHDIIRALQSRVCFRTPAGLTPWPEVGRHGKVISEFRINSTYY